MTSRMEFDPEMFDDESSSEVKASSQAGDTTASCLTFKAKLKPLICGGNYMDPKIIQVTIWVEEIKFKPSATAHWKEN